MFLWQTYLRWRHSRGYGVHSPYGFRFINEVMRPGDYAYYSYHELETLLLENQCCSSTNRRNGEFLIRLIRFLDTRRLVVRCSDPGFYKIVALASNIEFQNLSSENKISFKKGDLLLTEGEGEEQIGEAIGEGIPVYCINPGKLERELLESPIGNGLLIDWRKKKLLIPRQEMQYVSYRV